MKHKLALDFGTTNSLISRWDEATHRAQIIQLPAVSANGHRDRPPLVPSLLYVQNGQAAEVVIGQAVNGHALQERAAQRLFRNFKRGLLASPPPAARRIDGVPWSDHDAGRALIRRLIDLLPYAPTDIEQFVLTAPVASFGGYLDWLNDTLSSHESTLIDKIRIVDESTAAALGYAVTEPGALVLVFDLGGGTLDLSLVQLPDSRAKTGGFLSRLLKLNAKQHAARVIAKSGHIIGGSDIDRWLLAEVLRRAGVSPETLTAEDEAALLATCEQAKITLSTQEVVTLNFVVAGQPYTVAVTRVELEALLTTHGFYTSLRQIIDKVMHVAQQQDVLKEDIDHVLLVGGVSLMPSVQRLLGEYFCGASLRADKPFTAVVEGALCVAAGAGLDDYLACGYALRYLNPATGLHGYDELIPIGSRYPTARPLEIILTPTQSHQATIEFVFGQIDPQAAATLDIAYQAGAAEFVAQPGQQNTVRPLNADMPLLAALNPPGQPGEERLKAIINIDAQRRLQLSVTDLKTGMQILEAGLTLSDTAATGTAPAIAAVTGLEPGLSGAIGQQKGWRLSGRNLGLILNQVSPAAVSLNALTEALSHKDFYTRYNAATLLRRRGDHEARQLMQAVLSSGEVKARTSVARQLHGFSWFAAEPLIRQALADPDRRVREAVMYALCDRREASAYQLMAEVLLHEEDFVRSAAVWGLRECTDAQAVPVLAAAIQATDPEVRVKALDALSVNATTEAAPVVRRALSDPDPYVQYTATMSLLELVGPAGLPEIAQWLTQSRGASREHITRGFFQAVNHLNIDVIHHPDAELIFEALEAVLTDPYPPARMAAAWPLVWFDHEPARSMLKQAYYGERDDAVKAHFIHVAVNLLSPVGAELLKDGLRSQSEAVREKAEQIKLDIEAGAIVVSWKIA